MTIRSLTLEEAQLGLGIFRAEVRDRDADAGEGMEEVDTPLATELCGLPRREAPKLIELGGEEKSGLVVELVARQPRAEEHVVPVFDRQVVQHFSPPQAPCSVTCSFYRMRQAPMLRSACHEAECLPQKHSSSDPAPRAAPPAGLRLRQGRRQSLGEHLHGPRQGRATAVAG